jgi:hypothetical protein
MKLQIIGNAVAGVLFLIFAIAQFRSDSSGLGAVYLAFSALFIGLAVSGMKKK